MQRWREGDGEVTLLTRLGYEAWRPGVDEPSTHRGAEVRYGKTPRLLLCAYVAVVVIKCMTLPSGRCRQRGCLLILSHKGR